MVYPGRPSRGCHQCRRRKIGCDQTRPQCQRCINSGRQCPGYRDEIDLVLRSENEKTKQRVLNRQMQRAPTSGSGSGGGPEISALAASGDIRRGSWCSIGADAQAASPQRQLSIPPILGLNWERQSVLYFFDQYVMPPDARGNPGWLEFLPDLHEASNETSCLKPSLAAVSYANLANQSSIPWMSVQARHSYGEALRSINSALRDPEQVTTDETLTAVFLLGLFENINGEKRNILGNHGEGLSSLIRMRGNTQSPRSPGLFRVIYSLMQGRSLGLRQQPSPDSIAWWSKIPKPCPGLGKVFMNICRIAASADAIRTSPQTPDSRARLLDLMHEAEDIDYELQKWNATGTPWSVYQDTGDLEGLGTGNPCGTGNYSSAVHIYPDVWIASLWNFYRTGRIALHATQLECADFLDITEWSGHEANEGSPSSKYAKSICVIDLMVNEVCSSIPFILGDVDKDGKLKSSNRKALAGFLLMWPLYIVKNCASSTPEQLAVVKLALQRIGNVMGIRQALVMHDNGELPRPEKTLQIPQMAVG